MQDKYHLTLEQNLYLAKRNLIDSIWKSAKIEGINVTFPQTYAIVEKAAVQNVSVEDILKITNLKHAWQILIQEPEAPLTLEWLCKIHGEVAKDEALEWGKLRTGEIGVGGTDYVPQIPNADAVRVFCSKWSKFPRLRNERLKPCSGSSSSKFSGTAISVLQCLLPTTS